MRKINTRDFKVNKLIRAYEQRAAMTKPSGKEKDKEKEVLEFNKSLHKLTI